MCSDGLTFMGTEGGTLTYFYRSSTILYKKSIQNWNLIQKLLLIKSKKSNRFPPPLKGGREFPHDWPILSDPLVPNVMTNLVLLSSPFCRQN